MRVGGKEKVVLLVFQNPRQRRSVFQVISEGVENIVYLIERFSRKDKGQNDYQFSRLDFYITTVNVLRVVLRVDEGPPLCIKLSF